MGNDDDELMRPVLELARSDMALLGEDLDVGAALEELRAHDPGDRVIYLYVVDAERRLTGVLPVRRLLHARPEQRLKDLSLRHVVTLPESATVLDACEVLATHRFLALPVVDSERHVLGVVDVSLLSDQVFDLAEREEVEGVFETIGLRLSQVRAATLPRAFLLRFPWLLATIAGGSACAVLASVFEATLQTAIVLAFFLTLVLGLGDAITVQSLSLAIPVLRRQRPSWSWFARAASREVGAALLIGGVCGALVGLLAYAVRGHGTASLAIAVAITLTALSSSLLGLSVPSLLHLTRLDPTVAAGPVALALADIVTVGTYLWIATLLLTPAG